jgi:hypothetical protein
LASRLNPRKRGRSARGVCFRNLLLRSAFVAVGTTANVRPVVRGTAIAIWWDAKSLDTVADAPLRAYPTYGSSDSNSATRWRASAIASRNFAS